MKPFARHKARAVALQAIYQWQFEASSVSDIAAQFLLELNAKKVDVEYFRELLFGVAKELAAIDKILGEFIDRKITALNNVECAVLRLAIYELLYRLDVPPKVVINEALELAKKYGSIEGYKYVNGVLDKIVHSQQLSIFKNTNIEEVL